MSELTYSATPPKVEDASAECTRQMVGSLAKANASPNSKLGADAKDIESVSIGNETFVKRNFTPSEQGYCRKTPSPQASFAGRWSAKKAIFKSLGLSSKGAGAALQDIEISSDANGALAVHVSG